MFVRITRMEKPPGIRHTCSEIRRISIRIDLIEFIDAIAPTMHTVNENNAKITQFYYSILCLSQTTETP